ncbi:MAG: hypothetical protein NW217_00235 [Hyphomicrobiaceae bacterium]|nr:hypothetical protein [Hyphomicrobiaceae bacterium]
MRQKTEAKNRPLYRVSFARKTGVDDKGNDTLGAAREIGSVWPRRDNNGGILRLDHIPVELTQHQGVIFLFPADSANESRGF